jgi:hypothetical protein
MPLTEFQTGVGRLLAQNRTEDSYLAGGAAILAEPNTRRYSQDLDYFQDSAARVATAFEADRATLLSAGYSVQTEIVQPGYVRAVVSRSEQASKIVQATKVEWAFDSAWRFMPVQRSEIFGFQLHPIDLATNKVLALAGREEPRDLLDTLHMHAHVLELGPLVWAATGKDPGFSPLSLLALLRRRGRIRPEDLARLHLTEPIDVQQLKGAWLQALESADAFVRNRRPEEAGCLYYAPGLARFINPDTHDGEVVPHFGRPGGVLPRLVSEEEA